MVHMNERLNDCQSQGFMLLDLFCTRPETVGSLGVVTHTMVKGLYCGNCNCNCNCNYLIIHSPQGFSGIIYNTGWGTLPDCLRCSLQVLKE